MTAIHALPEYTSFAPAALRGASPDATFIQRGTPREAMQNPAISRLTSREDSPWLVDVPAWCEGLEFGYVVAHPTQPGTYWTGMPAPDDWTRNPRRALVDCVAAWDILGGKPYGGGRSVRVLIEDDVTMMPLHNWPRTPAD